MAPMMVLRLRSVRKTAGDSAVAWSPAVLESSGRWVSGVLWASGGALHFEGGGVCETWPAEPELRGAEEVRSWLRPGLRWRADGEVA